MNVVDGRPIPSRAYQQGTWLRDSYWTLLALGDRELTNRTWLRFAARQDPKSGQTPSALLNTGEAYYAAEDESTVFFLLLALDLRRAGIKIEQAPILQAGKYLLARLDSEGRVLAGPGPFSWWIDTLKLGERDVVAYTQGIWSAGLRAAQELGAAIPADTIRKVDAAYAALDQPGAGAITLSAKTTLLDVSCLVGEHLCIRLFGRPLLSDDVVVRTVRAFSRVYFPNRDFLGFKVATQRDGSYMPEAWFYEAPDNWPGYYHNGGSWLLYDAIALDVARSHDFRRADAMLLSRARAEVRRGATLNEYLATSDVAGQLGTVPFPWRKDYAWNSYVRLIL